MQLLEAGGGVGGTWYWNRYPGARFDSESYTYAYLFSKELFDEWEWQEHFARATGDRALPQPRGRPVRPPAPHALRRQGHLGRVRRAVGRRGPWSVGDGTEFRARFLVAATGVLSVPYFPDVPGREDFRGEQHHTGLWPATPVDFAGKRVAVIGTGSSGVQLIPAIAGEVASLTVYQRTANWCTPLNNAPITPDEQAQLRADFEAMRETLNTSVGRVPPPRARSRHLRRLRRRSGGRSSRRCGTAPASRSSPATTPTCCSITPRTPSGASSSPRRSGASSRIPRRRRS